MYQNNVFFTGKMNSDVSKERLPQGDVVQAFYTRFYGAISGNDGIAQSIEGNSPLEITLPTGNNKVIGGCPYTEAGAYIFFVWNSLDNHSIWKIDTQTSALTKIAESPIFNFQLTDRINHAFTYDNKLFWTDGYFSSFQNNNWNGPRMLDINLAIGGGTITRENISWDMWQPRYEPTAAYVTDNTVPSNYLTGKLFQFRYQWIDKDNRESVWSPISKMPIPANYFVEGIKSLSEITDNAIDVTYRTGSANITKIRLAYRMGNSGEFRIYKELNKAQDGIGNDTTATDRFINDVFIAALPLNLKNNERFPRIAKACDLLPTNEAALANVREGYDVEQSSLRFEYFINELPNTNGLLSQAVIKNFYNTSPSLEQYCKWIFPYTSSPAAFPFSQGDVMVFQITADATADSPATAYRYTVPSYTQTTSAARWTAFMTDLLAYFTGEGFTATDTSGGAEYSIKLDGVFFKDCAYPTTPATPTEAACTILHNADVVRTYKTGATHQFAVQYYDTAQKDGTVWRSPTDKVYVPPVSELQSLLTNPRAPFTISFKAYLGGLSSNVRPPMWATHYQLMYKPPKITFQWRVVKDVVFQSDGRVRLNLEGEYEASYRGASINMTPQKGDIVRFIRRTNMGQFTDPNTGDVVNYMGEYCDNNAELVVYEYGAEAVSGSTEFIIIDNIGLDAILGPLSGSPYPPTGRNAMIEIYRVEESLESDPWYEIGETWQVWNPHTTARVHGGDVIQVAGVSPAEVDLDGGDCYLKKRPQPLYAGSPAWQMCWVEDPYASDYFVSNYGNYGRIGIEDINAREKHLKGLVLHTNQYLDNTNVNRINQVDFQNAVYLREEYGAINKIIVNGYTLTCLQDRKNTSIYVQRTMSVGSDGAYGFAAIDRTFAQTRPLDDGFGTIHAGSVTMIDGQVYFYDYYNNAFVVSTGGGQQNLGAAFSFQKGTAEFTAATTTTTAVYATYDQNYGEIHWYSENQNLSVVFKPQLGFVFKMNHRMDFQGSISKFHYTFIDGAPYIEGMGANLNFFGTDVTQMIEWVFNVGPEYTKFYNNVLLQTNVAWNFEEITVGGILTNPSGMYSFIPAANFEQIENYLTAPYQRDVSDPSFEYEAIAYVEGRRLLGPWISHIMTYSGVQKSLVYNAAVNFGVSRPFSS